MSDLAQSRVYAAVDADGVFLGLWLAVTIGAKLRAWWPSGSAQETSFSVWGPTNWSACLGASTDSVNG